MHALCPKIGPVSEPIFARLMWEMCNALKRTVVHIHRSRFRSRLRIRTNGSQIHFFRAGEGQSSSIFTFSIDLIFIPDTGSGQLIYRCCGKLTSVWFSCSRKVSLLFFLSFLKFKLNFLFTTSVILGSSSFASLFIRHRVISMPNSCPNFKCVNANWRNRYRQGKSVWTRNWFPCTVWT